MTVIVLLSVALGACIGIPGEDPEEFSHAEKSIQIGKSTKAEVLEVLGESKWENTKDGSLYYWGWGAGYTFCGILLVGTFGWPIPIPLPYCDTGPPEDWWLRVSFDENEVVTLVEPKMKDEAEAEIDEMRRQMKAENLRVKAEAGDMEAAKELVILTGETTKALRELAQSGDPPAATLLARHANEFGPLRSLANSGDYEAAHILAAEFDDYSSLERLGKEDDYVAAYALYGQKAKQYRGEEEPSQFIGTWRWLCFAANAGYSKAQAEVGYWHRSLIWEIWNEKKLNLLRKVGVQSDNRIAYMWYTLAASRGDESAQHTRDHVLADLLTETEITKAEQMARDWKPGDCPSAEHRLAPPGET